MHCKYSTYPHIIPFRRPNPGLSPQHLTVATTVARMCGAALEGQAVRSTDLTFIPRIPISGMGVHNETREMVTTNIDTGTAASMTLIMQAVLPLAVLGSASNMQHTFSITGGTVICVLG